MRAWGDDIVAEVQAASVAGREGTGRPIVAVVALVAETAGPVAGIRAFEWAGRQPVVAGSSRAGDTWSGRTIHGGMQDGEFVGRCGGASASGWQVPANWTDAAGGVASGHGGSSCASSGGEPVV